MRHVFLDTMIYLHYIEVDKIDFNVLLSDDNVHILVPRITIQELDKHKNTHESQKIRDRAAKRLDFIQKVLSTDTHQIHPGVVIEYLHERPTINYDSYGLDTRWNDDVLLSSIIQFKQKNPEANVLLITQDTGPKLSCLHLKIQSLELPDKYKLPSEEDPLIRENRQLRNDLLKLQMASPKLILSLKGLEDNCDFLRITLEHASMMNEKSKNELLSEMTKTYPKMTYPRINNTLSKQVGVNLGGFWDNIMPESEFTRYNNEVDAYREKYSEYLDKLATFKTLPDRTLRLNIEIRNIGQQPADDVDIQIHFPDGFLMYSNEDFANEPFPPTIPQKPRDKMQIMVDQANKGLGFNILDIPRHFPNIPKIDNSFSLDKTNSYLLKKHFKRIKHGQLERIDPVFIVFESFNDAKSFKFGYSISAANMRETIDSTFHIVIEKQ